MCGSRYVEILIPSLQCILSYVICTCHEYMGMCICVHVVG